MKIAIVAPSPVPFTVGGAENLYWGLQTHINENTRHQCELVKIASPESNLVDLVDSYARFATLDLAHFDCVISTKYPSWMVRHDNHACYLLHRLRGLYDTYHFAGLQEAVPWQRADHRAAQALSGALDRLGSYNPTMVLDACRAFLQTCDPDAAVLQFPGPFARWLVHRLDGLGLQPGRVSRYAAISNVVKARRDYFPFGVDVGVLYPPPRISGFSCGSDDYLFTASRLDGPKRIHLLIEAMRHVKANIPLLIAGTGPEEIRLKEMAQGDQRIQFLGYVSDRELRTFYADALAVPFVPYDEDYGLITVEAMMSGKPVLTATDSGGPNEFVVDHETGFSVPPNPQAIAEKIDYLCANRTVARDMGATARARVASITWDHVVEGLTAADLSKPAVHLGKVRSTKPKMVVAVTFPIYPPRGGGQSRVYHLYRHLARYFDIEIWTLCQSDHSGFEEEIADGMREIRIPMSEAHHQAERAISMRLRDVPVTDVVMDELVELTPEYLRRLQRSASTAKVVVACHPYLGRHLRKAAPEAEFWLEAQDVELTLKQAILPDVPESAAWLEKVKSLESYCWRNAVRVFACACQDIDALKSLYGSSAAQIHEVANGVSIEDVPFVDMAERQRRKGKLGLQDTLTTLFMGSWHGPNIEAVEHVLHYAQVLPEVMFLIVGSVCGLFGERKIPDNVHLLGVVDDAVKAALLGAVDIALNPMVSGTGSNLKMLDYFASGVPVISTDFGVRGINAIDGLHFKAATIDGFPEAIKNLGTLPQAALVNHARTLAETQYAWGAIVERFASEMGMAGNNDAQLPLVA